MLRSQCSLFATILIFACGCGTPATDSSQAAPAVATDQTHWYKHGIGVVDVHSDGTAGHHGVVAGDGWYVTIRDGESYPGTTGGWYYQIGLQLPLGLKPGAVISLKPASSERHCETVGEFYRVGFLRSGEFVACCSGNPFHGAMACDDPSSMRLFVSLALTEKGLSFMLWLTL